MATTVKASAAERIQRLKKLFIDQLPDQLRGIKQNFAGICELIPLQNSSSVELINSSNAALLTNSGFDRGLEVLHRSVHTLKGGSASFGLKNLSMQAAFVENLAKHMLKGEFNPSDYSNNFEIQSDNFAVKSENSCESEEPLQSDSMLLWKNLMSVHLEQIEKEIKHISIVENECSSSLLFQQSSDMQTAASEQIKHTCGGKKQRDTQTEKNESMINLDQITPKLSSSELVVYICEDDPLQCANLADQIKCFGFNVSAFQEIEDFKQAVRTSPPDVIVMDMMHNNRETAGADAIVELMADNKNAIPVVFVSAQSDLLSRLAAVRAGSSAYFVKPANPSALCGALHALTTTEESEPSRIMIVEDDTFLSQMYAAILKDAGMETTILNDPLKAMPVLADFRPDLILMDMHMPGCNGMELAKAIRQMEEYISIPILFLSGETDIDLHFDARRMGGDEFLLKPIKPHHLISAVSVRADRMKLIRSFMIKDSMTGLYNHSAIKEYLAMYIERAIRNRTEISFAMIDIDKFKTVNDTYGHPVGDQVLVSLASLLKQRLRKSDIIGRYGGEEFAVILPECSSTEAVVILDQLRKNFASICFRSGRATFSSSFSCGVASLLDSDRCRDILYNDRMERICTAADEALYSAKHCGRNRVIAAPIDES